MRMHLATLRGAALLVPWRQRAEWLSEWRSELWYVRQSRGTKGVTAFCLGAFKDALWLRRNTPCQEARKMSCLESPVKSLLFLALLAAVSLLLTIRVPHARVEGEPPVREQLILINLHALLITFLVRPAITSLRLGEYPANSHSPPLATRLRRWFFLAIKIALIIQILFCTSASSKLIQPYVWVIYLLAFRWALIDQRQRCPVCLRLLTNPTRIGRPSQTFLEWYGIELMCAKGHGLLYVPEIPTSCYSTQRWLYLDPTWSSFFPSHELREHGSLALSMQSYATLTWRSCRSRGKYGLLPDQIHGHRCS